MRCSYIGGHDDGLCSCPRIAQGGIINHGHLTKLNKSDPQEVVLKIDGGEFARVMKNFSNNFPKIITVNPNSVKGRIFELLNKQTEKGLSKYGHALGECPDDKFDWRLMAMEEMADCIQYQMKEIMRLERLLNP